MFNSCECLFLLTSHECMAKLALKTSSHVMQLPRSSPGQHVVCHMLRVVGFLSTHIQPQYESTLA